MRNEAEASVTNEMTLLRQIKSYKFLGLDSESQRSDSDTLTLCTEGSHSEAAALALLLEVAMPGLGLLQ